jgi:hypothetical protein
MDNSDMLPEYTPFSSDETEYEAVELSSDREDIELPADHGFAELYSGHIAITTEYFGQQQSHIQELGVADDDSTQVLQFLAHGTYQPAELSTTTDAVFENLNENNTQNVQDSGWDLTPLNYDTTPEYLLHMYCSSEDLSMTDPTIMDAPGQQSHTSNAIPPHDFTELVSPVEGVDWNGRYPSTCDISPMGSFTESDLNREHSVFSASPSRSITETSVSSLESITTPPDDTPTHFLSFVGEPDRMCQDPIDEFEPLQSPKDLANNSQMPFRSFFDEPERVCQEPNEEHFHLSEAMSMSTNQSTPSALISPRSSGSNSTTDQSSSSSGYFSDMLHEDL